MPNETTTHMLLGALVSDAASLGLHWLYDPARIAELAAQNDNSAAFLPVDPAHFEGAKGYFAHATRQTGMLTQYGEVLRLCIATMITTDGDFDAAVYAQAFAAHFGSGGSYNGYIDRPTRGALQNMADELVPSGIDDDQLPAVATLPAILARYHRDPALGDMVQTAAQVTNINTVADGYSAAFTDLLRRVLEGAPLQEALGAVAEAAVDAEIKAALQDALSTTETDTVRYGETTGRACHLPMAGPLIFHILRHATDYRDAVERNIRAGGDNAGRSLMVGAVMAAVHGVATPKGVPLSWVLSLQDGPEIWAECQALAAP